MSTSSTLVETVSINCEDFSESFLTCSTCLCIYDAAERTPKLLPCSHTVCRDCLNKITHAHMSEAGSFRCPICRDLVTVPRGGVGAFPPSFIVNQLLDLMSGQRRDLVPRCSQHPSQELLFCETCDLVFCTACSASGDHPPHAGLSAAEHTIVPFAVALKRMSEILMYKTNLCQQNLNKAECSIEDEIKRLDIATDRTVQEVHATFQQTVELLEKRRDDISTVIRSVSGEKRRVLDEQLKIVRQEKQRVQKSSSALHQDLEVHHLTKRITELNERLDTTSSLQEPRENAFIRFSSRHNSSFNDISTAVSMFGRVDISTTFPSLCKVDYTPGVTTRMSCAATLSTVDYRGEKRTTGGDPVSISVKTPRGRDIDVSVTDNEDGSYRVIFTPEQSGRYKLHITIFERHVRGSPFTVEANDHNNPVVKVGGAHCEFREDRFSQPTAIAVDHLNNDVYCLDTANNRIKVLSANYVTKRHLAHTSLRGGSATGMALLPQNTLAIINWRTRDVTELSLEGKELHGFNSPLVTEPTAIATDTAGNVYISDSGSCCVFKFDIKGNLLKTFGEKGTDAGQLSRLNGVAVSADGHVICADRSLVIFSPSGELVSSIGGVQPETGKKSSSGGYSAVCVDQRGHVLAARHHASHWSICILEWPSGNTRSIIDSNEDRFRRPAGMATTTDGYVLVSDLGNDCIKVYRYL